MQSIWILANADGEGQVITSEPAQNTEQTTTTMTQSDGAQPTDGTAPQEKPNMLYQFAPLIIIFVVMYFLMFRGPKKKQQQHQDMVSSLSKNDRIRTIGGIFGTVLDVRENEIVIKIDESTNTKMRISPNAVATVLKDAKNE